MITTIEVSIFSFLQNRLLLLVMFLVPFCTEFVKCGFRETPAFSTGELHEKIFLRCSYFQEYDRSGKNQIVIQWLKADPQIITTGGAISSSQQTNFKPFKEDKKRIFIRIGSTPDSAWENPYPDIITNTSTIEILDALYEDMGRYKCIINGGSTYGGDESPIAEVKLTPRVFVDPTIVTLDRDKRYVSLKCEVSWLGWGSSSMGASSSSSQINPAADLLSGCTEPRIDWYTTVEDYWVNPYDIAQMNEAMKSRRLASQIENVRLEDRNTELRIYTDPEKYYYNNFNEKRRKKNWRQLERELIKAAGVFWCEFQYCFEKETLQKRANAIVKYPIKFDYGEHNEKMKQNVIGFVDETVELECFVIGGPYYIIKWGKGNQTLSMTSSEVRSRGRNDKLRYYKFERDPKTNQPTKLILQGLQYFDRAEYFCNATSFDGQEISASFMLRVKDQYTAYLPLSVIVIQVLLIFGLVFITEKFFTGHPGHLPKHKEHFSVAQSMDQLGTSREDRRRDSRDFGGGGTTNYNTYNTHRSTGGGAISGII